MRDDLPFVAKGYQALADVDTVLLPRLVEEKARVRIARLDLIAFGAFTDEVLDFGPPPSGYRAVGVRRCARMGLLSPSRRPDAG